MINITNTFEIKRPSDLEDSKRELAVKMVQGMPLSMIEEVFSFRVINPEEEVDYWKGHKGEYAKEQRIYYRQLMEGGLTEITISR